MQTDCSVVGLSRGMAAQHVEGRWLLLGRRRLEDGPGFTRMGIDLKGQVLDDIAAQIDDIAFDLVGRILPFGIEVDFAAGPSAEPP